MTRIDPPWRFDPHPWLVGVGWGARTGVLQFGYNLQSFTDHDFYATLTCLTLGLNTIPLGNSAVPTRVPPQRQADKIWKYAPKLSANVTTDVMTFNIIDRASYYVQTSSGLVTFYTPSIGGFHIPLILPDDDPGGTIDNWGLYWYEILEPLGSTFTTYLVIKEVLASHTVTESRNTYTKTGAYIFFFNLPAIKKQFPLLPKLEVTISCIGGPWRDTLFWSALLQTFRKTSLFPVDASNQPLWPINPTTLISGADVLSNSEPEMDVPPSDARFEIDLNTYAVTGERIDH